MSGPILSRHYFTKQGFSATDCYINEDKLNYKKADCFLLALRILHALAMMVHGFCLKPLESAAVDL